MTVFDGAAEVIAAWHDFPIGREPRPVVFLDSALHIGDQGFIDGEAKLAWLSGAVDAMIPLPNGVLDLVLEGRPRSARTPSLVISRVEPCEAEFWCDRGPRPLPAYRLEVRGLRQPCIVVDPAQDCWWHGQWQHTPGPGDVATVAADDVTIHFPAFGGAVTEFHHAEFFEASTCVIGHAVTSEAKMPPGTYIRSIGIRAKVAGRLAAPLGGRVLLHTNGTPIPVQRETTVDATKPATALSSN